jgi:hypothetical protein
MNQEDYNEAAKVGLFEREMGEMMFYPFVKNKPSIQRRNYKELKRLLRASV